MAKHNGNMIKYIPIYRSYTGEKCCFNTFYKRVMRGEDIEDAIKPQHKEHPARKKYQVCDEGRLCSKCMIFKTRDKFFNSHDSTTGHSSVCKECSAKAQAKRDEKEKARVRNKTKPIYIRPAINFAQEKKVEAKQKYEPPCIELSDLPIIEEEREYKLRAEDFISEYYM